MRGGGARKGAELCRDKRRGPPTTFNYSSNDTTSVLRGTGNTRNSVSKAGVSKGKGEQRKG